MLNVEHRQVRSSIFCVKNSKDVPWSSEYVQPDSTKCGARKISSLLRKSLIISEKIEGLSLIDTSFAPISRGSPTPYEKEKVAVSPSSTDTGHGGHYDTKYSLFG